MRSGQTCGSCVFFSALGQECRALPPQAVMIIGEGGKSANIGVFPATKSENWCGKWEAQPTSGD